jgi:hypothetical protein
MKSLLLLTPMLLVSFVASADTTRYYADRIITAERDSMIVSGEATVEDDGAFTPIRSLRYNAQIEPCVEDGDVGFSPRPAPCEPAVFDGESVSWTPDGRMYDFDTGQSLSIIRRGSEATGDPVLILMDDANNVFIFREVD